MDSHADPAIQSLQNRADRIFAYEKSGQKLSFNQLAALSIALEFRDYEGAAILVNALEREAGL